MQTGQNNKEKNNSQKFHSILVARFYVIHILERWKDDVDFFSGNTTITLPVIHFFSKKTFYFKILDLNRQIKFIRTIMYFFQKFNGLFENGFHSTYFKLN